MGSFVLQVGEPWRIGLYAVVRAASSGVPLTLTTCVTLGAVNRPDVIASGRGAKGRPSLPLPRQERQALRRHHAKVFVVVLLLLALVIGASSWWFYFRTPPSIAIRRDQIVEIDFFPVPEGAGVIYRLVPSGVGDQPLSQILGLVPIPLPAPLRQGFWCHPGSIIRITLDDDREITFGSCRLPDSIRAFRRAVDRSEAARLTQGD